MTRRDVWFLAAASGASVMNAFTAGVAYTKGDWWGLAAALALVAALGVSKGLRMREVRERAR
jgi:hypothetical protein